MTKQRTGHDDRLPRPTWLKLTLASAVCLAPFGALQETTETLSIEDTHVALEEWVETRRVISLEKRDWALGREVLEDRIEIVQDEIKALRERIAETEGDIAKADTARNELVAENEKLKEASNSLVEVIETLEERAKLLLPRVPEPIRERVKPLSQRFPDPESEEETKLSLGERFQNVVGVLDQINKYNREISVTSEVRTLPDGTSAEVTALYVGIGQGYYVTAGGDAAGIGMPTADGWTWKPANEAALQIQQAIAVLNNEQEATFVPLPLQVD